ncbi:CYTH and CHAD domain-containing protein [Glaciibacter sp. 2TAF33]|uniref:CYTH and CHAD domain-containing protein n=1 Tax=Glaciibacter sp. 2TAF33 TaxID=3233015 RepID=UPI003F8DDAD9
MSGSKQTEIERKYDVDLAAVVPDLSRLDGVAAVDGREAVTLTAVYYDTDAADLARHRITLRRREGGGDAGWHIKKPADEGRTEFHWPPGVGDTHETVAAARPGADAEDPAPAVPDVVLEPVRAIVRDRPLSPLARITTTRTVVRLLNADGEAIAEVADDQVSASDVRNGGYLQWREWEVEFLEAPPATRKGRAAFFDAVEAQLTAAEAHPSASQSKLARALGVESLTELEGAQTAKAPQTAKAAESAESAKAAKSAKSAEAADTTQAAQAATHRPLELAPGTAASVVLPALSALVDALVASDPAVRADEAGAVHQMRRVVSRLRSVLRTYRRLFDRAPVDALLDDLDRLGHALGEARDAEVRRARAATALEALPVRDTDAEARLVGGDRTVYAQALGRVRQLLGSESYFRLLDDLDAFVASPPLAEKASKSAKAQVRTALRWQVKRLRRRADAAQASDVDRDAALHEARKAARRLQRASAAVAPMVGRRQATAIHRITAAAKPIVGTLGDHRDGRLFAEHLKIEAQRARAAGEDTFVYGLLIGGDESDDDVLVSLRAAVRRIEEAAHRL